MSRVTAETRSEFREMVGLKALLPHLQETLEPHPEFLTQPRNRWAIAALVEFALQLATQVTNTQARAVRRFKRAAPRPTKRATGMSGAWRSQPIRCCPRKLERRQLRIGEQIWGVARATMPAGPARRSRPNAMAARLDLANPSRQLLTQQA
jgi:hypothetical protein